MAKKKSTVRNSRETVLFVYWVGPKLTKIFINNLEKEYNMRQQSQEIDPIKTFSVCCHL